MVVGWLSDVRLELVQERMQESAVMTRGSANVTG